jgi:hypothetical protein
MMGRTAAFAGAGAWNGLRGCAGVANAGDEDGIALDGGAAFLDAKNGGGGGLARLAPLSGLFGCCFRGRFSGLDSTIILAVFVEVKNSGMLLGIRRSGRSEALLQVQTALMG